MRDGVIKSQRTRRPRLKPRNLSQAKLLDAFIAGDDIELPPSYSKQSLREGDLAQETTAPFESDTRQPDSASDIRSSPAQRVTSTRMDPQQPIVKAEKADQTPTRQAPEPKPPKWRGTSLPEPKTKAQEQASSATRLLKRQIDSDSDERQLKRARLTRKNLAVFNKMVKKKGTNKGPVSAASVPPNSTVDLLSTKTTSTTSSGFAIQAYKNGILDPLHSKPPTNLEDLHAQYAESRDTASPTESEYKRYAKTVGIAGNEATIAFKVGVKLLKDHKEHSDVYHQAFDRTLTGFPKNVGFNNGLSAPKPDFLEGLEMQEFDPFPVDERISGAVLYRDDPNSLTLSHLAGELKGPDGSMKEATLQSGYDGAALVYARNSAFSYLGKPDPPGHAEVTTFTTDGTNIDFYAHYATPLDNGTLKYHQYQYASANIKDSHQGHKDGRRGLRNNQDRARKQSHAIRDQLKEHWKQRRDALQPIGEGAPIAAAPDGTYEETNVVELEAGYEMVEQPCQPTPAASSQSRKVSRSPPFVEVTHICE